MPGAKNIKLTKEVLTFPMEGDVSVFRLG